MFNLVFFELKVRKNSSELIFMHHPVIIQLPLLWMKLSSLVLLVSRSLFVWKCGFEPVNMVVTGLVLLCMFTAQLTAHNETGVLPE